jgi:hypothetical protein
MRSKVNARTAISALTSAAIGLVLAGCGGGDPELDFGPDFSSSPLQFKTFFEQGDPQLFGQVAFVWEEIEGATHYRFFADVDGDSDGEFEFVQIGADIPAGTDPLEAVFDGIPGEPFAAHTFDWQRARFMLQSCDASGCIEAGQQDLRYVSAAFILPIAGAGSSVAYAESDDTVVIGSPINSIFACETLVPVETPTNQCEYDETLTQEEIDALQLFETIAFAGSANVYVLEDGLWALQQVLKASNIDAGDSFGADVVISDDGNTLVVSALNEDSNATGVDGDSSNNDESNSGAAYVFKRDGMGVWTEVAYIKPSTVQGGDTDGSDLFGSFLAMSGDGTVLAVSAWYEDSSSMLVGGDESDDSAENAGAVFVFRDLAGVWSQDAYLKPLNTGAGDLFGSSLAVSSAGDRLAIGALSEDSGASGVGNDAFNDNSSGSGAVYIFDYSGGWMQSAYIKSSAPNAGDEFGAALALNAAGDVLAVSALNEDSGSSGVAGDPADNSSVSTGAVYVFDNSGGAWSQSAYLKASNADPVDEFGHIVRLNATGNRLLATSIREGSRSSGINGGQELDDFVASGAGYLFLNDGGWQQQAYIKASNNTPGSLFGWRADFSSDGLRMIISAFNTATVYIF